MNMSLNFHCQRPLARVWGAPIAAMLAAIGLALAAAGVRAQQATLRARSTVVLVPALVRDRSGKILYDLTVKDFEVDDNGVPQTVQMDPDFDVQPISIVVAVQTGGAAAWQFEKVLRTAILLDSVAGEGQHETAVLAFDGTPHLLQDFTADDGAVSSAFKRVQPGDGGAAIRDAVFVALGMLAKRPPENRRIILLISETRDHGSRTVTVDNLARQISASNTTIYSLAFSPGATQVINDLHGVQTGPEFDLITPLTYAVNAMRHNTANAVANISGGEYLRFNSQRALEARINALTNHMHSQYLLSFQPLNPTPGFHAIQVRLRQPAHAVVRARTGYWASAPGAAFTP
jgi:VWFA-related protein